MGSPIAAGLLQQAVDLLRDLRRHPAEQLPGKLILVFRKHVRREPQRPSISRVDSSGGTFAGWNSDSNALMSV